MATDISSLLGKVENGGQSEAGRVSAREFNTLVTAVMESQNPIKTVILNGVPKTPDASGNVELTVAVEVPTKTSQLTNDSGFLTEHQDISGKLDKTEASNIYQLKGDYATNESLNTIGVKSEEALSNSEQAVDTANVAKNAVATLEGLANSTTAMETLAGQVVQIEENKKDIFFLKGAYQKEIADSIVWTKGVWNYTNNSGGGAAFMKETYRYSNKIDISNYDEVMLSGLWYGGSSSTNDNRMATVSFFGDGEPIGWRDESNGSIINIYRADYAQYNKLEIVVNAFQSEETYIPSVKVSAEGNAVLKEEFSQLKEKVNTNELAIFNLVGNEFDLSQSLQWKGGFINIDGTITTAGANATVYRHTYVDVRNYDIVTYSGLIQGNYQTVNNRAINVVADGVIVENIPATSGEIICSDYDFNESLVLAISARTDTEVTIVGVVTRKIPTIEESNELKEQVSANENGIEALKITIEGVNDKEIADTITWAKGAWSFTNNSGPGSSYMQGTFRYSNKIDISNYDSAILSGLANGGPMSNAENRWPTISIFGDGEPIAYQQVSDGNTFVIYRSDYKQYEKLEIIILAYQSEETHIPSIKVTKKGIAEGGEAVAKRIVLCGDSLTGNDSALLTYEFKSIAKSQGYEIVRNSMGGENIIGNLTRNGGIGIRVTQEFTIPESGSVNIFIESAWMKSDGAYAQNPYNSLSNRNVIIMGIEGKLTRVSTTEYTFTRNVSGHEMKVGVGVIFWDEALWDCKDYPHVWFTGQNGGYENEADWADMINSAARNFGENFIVCSTALSGTTNELVRQATKTFGDKYINLRAYTQGQAVYDGQRYGLIDSSYTAADYEALFWPGSDKVHQNNLLSYIWAVLMWNTLLDLGYVEGERIDTGEYYLE